MTWTSVGSFVPTTTATTSGAGISFSLTPSTTGNLVFLEVINQSTTVAISSIQSSNMDWGNGAGASASPIATYHATGQTNGNTFYVALFAGKTTTASAATVTVTCASTATSGRLTAHEFHSSIGSWFLGATANLDSAAGTATFPSVAASGLYFGYAFNNSSVVNGSTSGFVYGADANGNGAAFNLTYTSGATGPVWGDSANAFGIMAVMQEGVNSTGSVSLARMSASGSGAETISATSSLSLTSMAAHGTGTENIATSGSVSMATMGATGSGAATTAVAATGSLALSSMSATAGGGITSTLHGTVEGGALGASGSALVALSHLTVAGSAAGGVTRVRGALVVAEATPPPPVLRQPPVVANWLSGDPLDAASMNTYIRDTFMYLANPPLLRVAQNAVQPEIPTAQWTVVTLQDVIEDTYSGWSPNWNIGNAYQAQVPGWHSLTLNVSADVPSGALGRVGFWYWSNANGVYVGPIEFGQQVVGPAASYWTWHAYDETYLQVDDLVLPMFYHQAGVSVSTDLSSPSSFEVAWISS